MSIKTKVLAAVAVLTLAGGLSAAGTMAASAATPQCASQCITPRSAAYPGFVETVLFGIPLRGAPTIVTPAAGWNPGEDFTVPTGGPVNASYFAANGMISAATASHYSGPGYLAPQIEYAPYGKPSGLCSAIPTTDYPEQLAAFFEIPAEELDSKAVADPYAAVRVDTAIARHALPPGRLVSGLVYDVSTGLIDIADPATQE